MKTFYSIIMGVLLMGSMSQQNAYAQIQDLDPTYYYYMVMGDGNSVTGQNLIGPQAGATANTQVAQLEMLGMDNELWQIIEVTDTTYRFVNLGTELALDRTDEVPATSVYAGPGEHDDIGQEFENSGWPAGDDEWPALAVQENDESVETQEWAVIPIPDEVQPEDTVYYNLINVGMGYENLYSINVWRGRYGSDFVGTQNFCLMSYADRTGDLEDANATVYFVKSDEQMEVVSVHDVTNHSVRIYAHEDEIVVRGVEYGQRITVYSVVGTKVYEQMVQSSEIRLNIQEKGIYIVNAGPVNQKVMIR